MNEKNHTPTLDKQTAIKFNQLFTQTVKQTKRRFKNVFLF